MKSFILIFVLIVSISQCEDCSCNLPSLEEYIIQNEGVCYCAYLDSEKLKTIGVGFNISTEALQKQAQTLLNLTDKKLAEIVSGETNITPEQTKILFDQRFEETKNKVKLDFPDFDSYDQSVQYVLVDMKYTLNNKLKEFERFKAALEISDFNNAKNEIIDSDYCHQTKTRCDKNSCTISKCPKSNLQKMNSCFQKNCSSDIKCLEDKTCYEQKMQSKSEELKFPCITSCAKQNNYFYSYVYQDSNQIQHLTRECKNIQNEYNEAIQNSEDFQKVIKSYEHTNIAILNIIRNFKLYEDYDPYSPFMCKILKSFNFCPDDTLHLNSRGFYCIPKESQSNQVNDNVLEAIQKRQKDVNNKCNCIQKQKTQPNESTNTTLDNEKKPITPSENVPPHSEINPSKSSRSILNICLNLILFIFIQLFI